MQKRKKVMMVLMICIICLKIVFAKHVLGYSSSLETIYKQILNNNKNIPPSGYFILRVTLKMSMMIDISEVNDKLSTVMLFHISWQDKRYSWDHINGTDYPKHHVQDYLTLDDNLVWRPIPFLHRDKTGGSGRLSKIDGITYLTSNGTIDWIFSQRLETYCGANTRFYPFDIQQCLIELSFPDFPNMHVTLPKTDELCMEDENGNWKITECDVNSRNNYIQFFLQFKRIPTRPFITLILPVFTLAPMSPLVFLLPAGSGERTALSLTTLLAISVYMTIVGEDLPKISDPLAIIDIVLCIWFVSNSCVVLLVILNEKIYNIDDRKPVPVWIHRLTRLLLQPSRHADVKDSDENPKTKLKTDEEEDGIIYEPKITWKKLSRYLDKIFLVVIFVMKLLLVVVIAFYLAYGDQTKSDLLKRKLTNILFQGRTEIFSAPVGGAAGSSITTTMETEDEYQFFRFNANK